MEVQLDFTNQMFVELLSEDGLIILARYALISYLHEFICYCCHLYGRGLGLDGLFINFLKLYSDPHSLVLVLNTSSTLEVQKATI